MSISRQFLLLSLLIICWLAVWSSATIDTTSKPKRKRKKRKTRDRHKHKYDEIESISVVDDQSTTTSSLSMPPPFTRVLQLQSPTMSGHDVILAQNLLSRSSFVPDNFNISGQFDADTAQAVADFQQGNDCPSSSCHQGELDAASATLLLKKHSCDGYKDSGASARSLGYKYKVVVPVHGNRSIETNATLYDADNNELLVFRVRAHGHDDTTSKPWPDFNNSVGLNMFTSNGNTPTGLMRFDLNSPEGDDKLYGPYPVNRAVDGLEGNAAFILPHIRSGILLHTGEWSKYSSWEPPENMPNSAGCIHSWPANIKAVWEALTNIGIQVRDNPGGVFPYPYQPQGLLSVEQIDGCSEDGMQYQ